MDFSKLPSFQHEIALWQKGINVVAGADEVGRGAFAGPVVTAIVAFSPNTKLEVEINDSKKLSIKKRELAAIWIKKHALFYSIGQGSVSEINQLGIVKAIHRAYRRAIGNYNLKIENLLTDAFPIPYLKNIPQTSQIPLIKGDQISSSIAAASIIAKVYRDNLMCDLHKQNKTYHWHRNKGYGTIAHRQAIQKHGLSPHHRIKFTLSSYPSQSDT